MLQRDHNGRAVANDAVGLELHQLLRKSLHAPRIAFGIAVLDAKVLADGPALRFETLLESHQAASGFGIVAKPDQHPHGAHANCRLRICRNWPACDCAAEQRDEIAPSHVWMAPAWQEKIERAAQKALAVMCPACSRSPDGLLALMGSANRGLITRAGSMSQ